MSLFKKRKPVVLTEGNALVETIYEICTFLLFTGYFLFYDNRGLQLAFVCIGLAGTLLLFLSKVRTSRMKIPINTIWYLLFFVLAELSALWAHSPEDAAISYLRLMMVLLVIGFGITLYVDTTAQAERLIKVFVFSAFVFSAVQFFFTPLDDLLNGFFGSAVGDNNTNNYGYIVSVCTIITVYFAYVKNQKSYYFFALFFIVCCFLSSSRKSLIITFVGVFLLVLFSSSKKNRFFHIFIGLLFAVIFVILMFEDEFLYNIIGNRFDSMLKFLISGYNPKETSMSLRAYFIEFAKILLREKPLLGHGFANFLTIIASEGDLDMGYTTHNNYWEILADLGVVGFITYYWFYLFISIKLIIKMLKEKDNTIIPLALALIISQFAVEYGLITMASFYPQIVMSLIYVCTYASNSQRKFHYSPTKM
ncbi:MAG: O-antigen ligase family protein [Clostridia bacterium]|nr:O-antigen ligase family protein [Clostridia bacterium]